MARWSALTFAFAFSFAFAFFFPLLHPRPHPRPFLFVLVRHLIVPSVLLFLLFCFVMVLQIEAERSYMLRPALIWRHVVIL